MANHVTLEGLPQLKAALARKAAELRDASTRAVAREVDNIADDARQKAPRAKGDLRSGINSASSGPAGEVRSTARHSTFVEHGTYKDPAQPFMEPSADSARRRFPRVARDIISKALGG